ncbi:MAG: hypothetical protein HC828_16860 [Blastochloris sp.]|nr:hypothetical protein [Blastochloris sp.]
MVGDAFPPDWERLAYHNFQYEQTFYQAGIALGNSLEEFVHNSQVYQARLLKFAIERYRTAKYRASGGMYQFMFVDCWPSVTWSVVSHARVPKQGYYTLQQVYQPVLIGAHLIDTHYLIGIGRGSHERPVEFTPWVVNDLHHMLTGCHYTAHLEGPGGHIVIPVEGHFDVQADSVFEGAPRLMWSVPHTLPPGTYTLTLALKQDGSMLSQNTYEIAFYRAP